MTVGRPRAWPAVVGWVLLLLAVADWHALRIGVATHPPSILAGVVALCVLSFAIRLVQLGAGLAKRPRRASDFAETILLAGLIVTLLAGMTNWLRSLQGAVILSEGEAVRLHRGADLQMFEGGPLARLDEMELHLELEELELVPAGTDGFYPRSRLRAWREGGEPRRLDVTPRAAEASGTLRFHQGAFGFSPRVVIQKDDVTVFDRIVPFVTERGKGPGLSFEGRFSIAREGLDVEGRVDLASLDEGMRGHATLELAVSRESRPLGRGRLLPGHFADIDEGFRIGFVGLEQWSEIVISRRNYAETVLAGAAVALAGAVLWPLARWRER